MEDDLSIPAFLRLTREQRRQGWERWLAARGGRYTDPRGDGASRASGESKRDWRKPQSLSDEEWAYWLDIEARKAAAKLAADQPRFEAMRLKAKQERDEIAAVREQVRATTTTALAKQPQSVLKSSKRKPKRRNRAGK